MTTSTSLRFALLLTCASGFLDSYTFLARGGVFANAQTGNVIFLGLVPIPDLFQLMRRSLAVVQPSLFEGWSTIVEEVKSLGCPILLSDLAVHREQQPEQAVYFDSTDVDSMAETFVKAWGECAPGPHGELELTARERFSSRAHAFAGQFMQYAAEAVAAAGPNRA